jgi:DNA polymerase zeta
MHANLHLKDYEIDRVAFHLLQKREPKFSHDCLSREFNTGYPGRYKVFEHVLRQLELAYEFMDTLDLINRNITMAKTYGIDLQSVESRGSQYRVESLLSRIARINRLLLLSGSTKQVRKQDILEVIPLVIEPERTIHMDPVAVLDFQSLYPSIIISHNIWYSTCLGKIEKSRNKFGVYRLSSSIKEFFGYTSGDVLSMAEEDEILGSIIVSPNLVAFVKPHIRKGLLPQMLSEILNTRIMIKKSMKLYPKNSFEYRVLDARQYSLKMISNVTYGYTAAGWNGRMPWVHIADAIVSFARLSLESVLKFTESDKCYTEIMDKECHAKVIYGDTDSIFVKFPNLGISKAYEYAQRLINYVTENNPYPMELKYEKVYRPLFNLAKKRYCGYKYETPKSKPEVESKGIETIRRDFLPIVSKIMYKVIHILFIHNDMSLVKKYLENQWLKLSDGNIEAVDLFLKDKNKDPFSDFTLPDTEILIKKAEKELSNVLNRIFLIFGTEVEVWTKSLFEKNTSNLFIKAQNDLGIMNKTKEFDSKFVVQSYKRITKVSNSKFTKMIDIDDHSLLSSKVNLFLH